MSAAFITEMLKSRDQSQSRDQFLMASVSISKLVVWVLKSLVLISMFLVSVSRYTTLRIQRVYLCMSLQLTQSNPDHNHNSMMEINATARSNRGLNRSELTKRSPRSKTNVTTVLSKDPDASRLPSQFHATECTLEE